MPKTEDTLGPAQTDEEMSREAAPVAKGLSGELVSYRVLKKGHNEIFTGRFDKATGEHERHPRGAIVRGVDRTIAEALEDRGFAEIVEDGEA